MFNFVLIFIDFLSIFATNLALLGACLGGLGAILGPILGILRPSWGRFGTILGPTWGSWGHLEATWTLKCPKSLISINFNRYSLHFHWFFIDFWLTFVWFLDGFYVPISGASEASGVCSKTHCLKFIHTYTHSYAVYLCIHVSQVG